MSDMVETYCHVVRYPGFRFTKFEHIRSRGSFGLQSYIKVFQFSTLGIVEIFLCYSAVSTRAALKRRHYFYRHYLSYRPLT